MIITSKINNKKYFWIKIPRTGTVAYSNLFNSETETGQYLHMHLKYQNKINCNCNGVFTEIVNDRAVTVVRNPTTRFISSLKYLSKAFSDEPLLDIYGLPLKMACVVCGNITTLPQSINQSRKFFKFYENEKTFYEFFYDNFDKNCVIKSGENLEDIFKTENPMLLTSFFHTQVYWAYHPNVKIFKYENIAEFNHWIESELGHDTSTLKIVNASTNAQFPIDFTTEKFKKLVTHLFYDDFRYFNYDFPV